MKKILFVLTFIWIAGMLPAHAYNVELSPYPPVYSTPMDNLPEGYNTIFLGYETFYYHNGSFYQKVLDDSKYAKVPAPIGAVVYELPEGYQYMVIDSRYVYVYDGVYYKRLLNGYMVIPALS